MSHLHERVSALVDGELKGGPRRRALDHLRRCEPCRVELEEILVVKRRLSDLASCDPPVHLALAGASAARASAVESRRTRRYSQLLVRGVSGACLAVLTVAYAVGGPGDDPALTTPPVEEFAAEFAAMSAGQPLADAGPLLLAPAPGDSADRSRDAPARRELLQPAVEPGLMFVSTMAARARSDDPAALRGLERAGRAPDRYGYRGVERVESVVDGRLRLWRIHVAHEPGQGTSYGRSSSDPGATFVAATARQPSALATVAIPDMLTAAYDVTVGGAEPVAGRRATVVAISTASALVARFWVDDQTGLLLRRDLFDKGRLIRSSVFTRLHITRSFLSHLPPVAEVLPANAVSLTNAPALDDAGWVCPETLAGGWSLESLTRVDSVQEAMQAIYTDGLSTVSVFEQRGSLDTAGLTGFEEVLVDGAPVLVRPGVATAAVWESDDTVFTLVTDAPPSRLVDVVAALPHAGAEPDPSPLDRLGVGLSRLVELASAP